MTMNEWLHEASNAIGNIDHYQMRLEAIHVEIESLEPELRSDHHATVHAAFARVNKLNKKKRDIQADIDEELQFFVGGLPTFELPKVKTV